MNIGLLGYGTVGKGVVQIVNQMHSSLQVKKILVHHEEDIQEKRMTTNIDELLDDSSIDVIVECIGGLEPAHTYVIEALKHGKHVVTANKKMVAKYYQELHEVANDNHCLIRYEASVAGGIPWLSELERIKQIDRIQSFTGIFNGTTNYILTMMSQGCSFDQALLQAQQLGYAESDPSDDIDGLDIRSKCMISVARSFFAILDVEKIFTFGIRYIQEEDITWANRHNYIIKMMGQARRHPTALTCFVMPKAIKQNHLMSQVNMNLNGITVSSTTLGESTYIGQGAGSLPTAHAVLQDVLAIAKGEGFSYQSRKIRLCNRQQKFTFYIRGQLQEIDETKIMERINETTILTVPLYLRELKNLLKHVSPTGLFVMEVESDD